MNEQVSPELDALAGELFVASYETLAHGQPLWPQACCAYASNEVECATFSDDELDACLVAAREWVSESVKQQKDKDPVVRYVIAYDAEVSDPETLELLPAVIVEFSEDSMTGAYSAFSWYELGKSPADFVWSEPAPAGEEERLL